MPTERIIKRINSLLDEAEEALAENHWDLVISRCRAVLALQPDNEDATEYIAAAERISESEVTQFSDVGGSASTTRADSAPTSIGNGRYTIKRLIGEGGKKKVYLAHDTTLDIDVALAQIKTEGLDETGRERIRREAQAMARLGIHPHVMPIYDLSEENGQPFMVQPLMAGGDVEGLIEKADGPLLLDAAIKIAVQTAEGLAFAHSKGIIHRDLKPGNVWLDEDGSAKIGDFGLAIATDRTRITVEKIMVGTVAYMPPEQATGAEVTTSADLYSLGAMLYEMCTGNVPFRGDDDIGIISQHINTPPVAPSWHNKQIPQSLNSLIMRMLAKDPVERPDSANEVITALQAVDLSAVDADLLDQETSLDSMADGVFVGRHREMDQLKAAFEEVLSGKGHLVTLVGEPGIGKTRIAKELATYARLRRGRVVWGMSYESGGEPPYWLWVRAIRDLVADLEPEDLRTQLGAAAPVIADLVDAVRVKLPDIPEPIVIKDADAARFRLFDSVATFLKSAAQIRPLVVMLEDLHWADRPSLMLLEFIARELPNSKLMLVCNYRDVELSRRHPLSITLGELGRERRIERVLLRGLQRHDVERFIEIAAGISPPSALVDAVHTQTEGNPLFITETVRLLVQEGDLKSQKTTRVGTTSWEIRIPEGVREVIGRRLDRLSERCNDVLTTAAVIGRQFRFSLLMALVEDASENMLLDVLDEVLSSRIVEELKEEVGLYQFTHALMQETLTSELSANRIVRMHARIAESLENYYGDEADEHAAELCEHFAEAETVLGPEKVIKYALLAGKQAALSFAWDEALIHFERAKGAKESRLPRSSRQMVDAETAVILRHLRQAQSALSMPEQAEATLQRLYDHYVAIGDVSEAVAIICEQQFPSSSQIESALKLVPDDSHEAGKLLAWHGRILGLNGDYDDAESAFYNAMAIAQREDDQSLALRVMINSNEVDIAAQQYGADAVDKGRRYIEIARQAGDKFAEAEAQVQTTWSALYVGDPDTAQIHARNFKSLADELRLRSVQRYSLEASSSIARSMGDFRLAKRLANQGVELEDHFQLIGQLADIELELGNYESSRKWLTKLENVVREIHESKQPNAQAGQALFVLLRTVAKAFRCGINPEFGEDARQILDEGIWNDSPVMVNPNHKLAHILIKVHFKVDDGLQELIDSLEPIKNIFLAPFADVGHTMAIGAVQLGQFEKAEDLFKEAADRSRNAGYRPELAWTLADYAEMKLSRNGTDDRATAWELQSEALGIASELGMRPLVEKIVAAREHRGA